MNKTQYLEAPTVSTLIFDALSALWSFSECSLTADIFLTEDLSQNDEDWLLLTNFGWTNEFLQIILIEYYFVYASKFLFILVVEAKAPRAQRPFRSCKIIYGSIGMENSSSLCIILMSVYWLILLVMLPWQIFCCGVPVFLNLWPTILNLYVGRK